MHTGPILADLAPLTDPAESGATRSPQQFPLGSLLGSTYLNTTDIPQPLLDISNKKRSNLLPWRGQFSPQFVNVMLHTYASKDCTVLDPFLGSGTVLCEAGRMHLQATGTEINPAAFTLARLYELMNLTRDQREACTSAVAKMLRAEFPKQTRAMGQQNTNDMAVIIGALDQVRNSVADPCCRKVIEALIVLADYWTPGLCLEKLLSVFRGIESLVLSLPFAERPLAVVNGDARQLALPDNSIDLVLTSPPYINVHNYHQQYRRSAEALGANLLHVAKSEIGANRKHRGNRFLTVIQYCLDMAQSLVEMKRVCKPNSSIIMVLGRESTVRSTRFFNGEIVARLGTIAAGLELSKRQERAFRNRFGQMIFEDILHFRVVDGSPADALSEARAIALQALSTSRHRAAPEVKQDIESALSQPNAVRPSPMYTPAYCIRAQRPGGIT